MKKLGRASLSAVLAVSLAACGGGGGDSGPRGPVTGGGGGGGSTACSLSERQDWALSVLEEWYLFPDLLDTSVNKANFSTVQAYIDALVAPARAQGRDDGFTFLTSIQEENERIQNGSNAGFGIRLVYDRVNNRVFIAEAFENAPAFPAGFDRGTQILQIGGQSVSQLMASGGPTAVINALGPSDPGVTRSFIIRSVSGVETSVSVTKAEYSQDPISDRYGVEILDDGAGGQVGYLNLRTFIIQDAEQQLIDAFAQFRAQGVTDIILDFRYNSGGLVFLADLLGDLLGEGLEGQVFSRTELRPSKSAENSTELFEEQAQQVDTMRLAVISTDSTASASELVPNSMIPYLGSGIALIGSNTSGKPVGQFAFDRSVCDDRLRAVTFRTVNADGQGDYFNGLASVMPNTCRANDDIFTPLGDPGEASISVALDFIAGRSCTPISGAPKDGTVQAEASRMEVLQPVTPNAMQRDNPGVF